MSAGVGVFNATFSAFWLPSVLAFQIAALVPFLFSDTRLSYLTSSGDCSGPGCVSYFFTGGMSSISPSPYMMTQLSEADTFVVQAEQGLQVDYWNVSAGDVLTTSDCRTWAVAHEGFMICISTSRLNQNNLIAGFLPCQTC